jgi:hypothetical protein
VCSSDLIVIVMLNEYLSRYIEYIDQESASCFSSMSS